MSHPVSADAVETARVRSADGLSLHLRLSGPARGRPVVLLHGINQWGGIWQRQLSGPLSWRYRLIAPDLRGHGDSDPAADASGYQGERPWADDLHAVIGGLGLEHPVLVGWSFGGRIPLMYRRLHGEANLSGIVLVDTVVHFREAERSAISGQCTEHLWQASTQADYEKAVREFCRLMSHRELPASLFEDIVAANLRVPREVFRALRSNPPYDYTPDLEALGLPALVIHGEHDVHSLRANGRRAHRHLKGAKYVAMAESGHMPFLEQPEAFDEALADFLEGCA